MTKLWGFIQAPFKRLQRYVSSINISFPHAATEKEIAAIMDTNLFRKMTDDELAKLIHSIQIKKYNAGDLILKEGDIGDELFIITEGLARVFIIGDANKKIQLKILLPGNYFGEQAVSAEKMKTRNANIEAVTEISLIKIHGKYIYNLLKKDDSLKSLIEERQVNQIVNGIVHASIFKNEIESLLSSLDNPKVMEFQDKECIFEVGDTADYVYMVIQGKVKLFIPQKKNDSFSKLILNKGHLFGELGVLNDAPRAGTAIAEGFLRLLAIDGSDFRKDTALLKTFKEKMAALQRMYALPLRGTVEQYTQIESNGGVSMKNIYNLADGRVVHSSSAFDKDIFNMWNTDKPRSNSICYDNGDDHVEICIQDHRLTSIKANSSYHALPALCYLLLDNVNIEDKDVELFKTTGKLKVI